MIFCDQIQIWHLQRKRQRGRARLLILAGGNPVQKGVAVPPVTSFRGIIAIW